MQLSFNMIYPFLLLTPFSTPAFPLSTGGGNEKIDMNEKVRR